ncbi:hypothetical protein PEL8287_02104 [Roseovarius litorisediminis]|uniref:Uncharacterized protein n=1 Tax=Roseovarius litorisediminis TaxID=1312363 RepID=A0A1Y5SJT9_9RHOB|nr:hypothetical protein PEL8287_02104 [Roseovarius litorisediminis]
MTQSSAFLGFSFDTRTPLKYPDIDKQFIRLSLDLCAKLASVNASREICRNPSIAMLFYHGEIVMKILSKRQVTELVLYSPQHIARLDV